jgi:formyltetrahydrofolate hydrolase
MMRRDGMLAIGMQKAILVSAYDHCLADLICRHSTGELLGDNGHGHQQSCRRQAPGDFYHVPFHLLTNPKTSANRSGKCLICLDGM